MKKRLYLLENSFPEKIVIENSDITEEYSYTNCDEFKKDIDNLFKKSNSPKTKVYLILNPSKCRNISFHTVFGFEQQIGWNDLSQYGDIRFYKCDTNDKEIFDDLLLNYIKQSNNNIELNKYLNSDYEKKGNELLRVVIRELLDYSNDKNVVEHIEGNFLTDTKVSKVLSEEYNSYININQFLYEIYLVSNNYNDIRQIVRDLLIKTENELVDYSDIYDRYDSLSKYCMNMQNNYQGSLTFSEIESAINAKFDYKMLIYYSLFEDFGFRFTSFDFDKQIAYFKNVF